MERLKMRNPWVYFQVIPRFTKLWETGDVTSNFSYYDPTVGSHGFAPSNFAAAAKTSATIPFDVYIEVGTADNDGYANFVIDKNSGSYDTEALIVDLEGQLLDISSSTTRLKEDGSTKADSVRNKCIGDIIKVPAKGIKVTNDGIGIPNQTADSTYGITLGAADKVYIVPRKVSSENGNFFVSGTDLLAPAYSFVSAKPLGMTTFAGDLRTPSVLADTAILHFKDSNGKNGTDAVTIEYTPGKFNDLVKGLEHIFNSKQYTAKQHVTGLDVDGNVIVHNTLRGLGIDIYKCTVSVTD